MLQNLTWEAPTGQSQHPIPFSPSRPGRMLLMARWDQLAREHFCDKCRHFRNTLPMFEGFRERTLSAGHQQAADVCRHGTIDHPPANRTIPVQR